MSRKFSSVSLETDVVGSLTTVATSIDVVSASNLLGGINDADISASNDFIVVIDPETSNEEIVKVTAVSGNTLTVTRGHDGSTAKTHTSGAKVRHMAIGEDLRLAAAHRAASTAVHGLSGTVVGTTDTQTLTNKTLTSPTITGTGAIAGTFTGNLTGNVTGNASGNAGTATALQTGRTFQIVGDVEASGQTFDGTSNVTLTTSIGTGVIVNADVNASAAIDKTKISGTAITAADTGTVTSAMIADGTIVNADLSASAGIAYSKLSLNSSITSADIVDGTIVNADINASAAIDKTKISGTAITAADTGTVTNAMLAGSIDTSKILNFDSEVQQNRLDQMAAPTADVSLNSQKITSLATPTADTDASTKLYVDTQINNLVNGAPSTLDTLAEIAAAISDGGSFEESVVLRSGAQAMTGNLNLDSNKVVNVATPTDNGDATNKSYVDSILGSATDAAASAAAAATTYDNFDDRYLGAKASPPSTDNDGDALVIGALYWDTGTNAMYAWTGSAWGSISSTAQIYRYRFTASGGETSVSGTDDLAQTLSYIAGKEQVYLNGVLLVRTTDYTATNGSSITALAALTAGDVLEVITFTSFDLATAIQLSSINAKGDLLAGSAANTVGTLAVGTDGQVLTADSSTATGLAWAEGLPSQTGNSGKYLSTDGSTASWESVDALPSQTGNDGKYLSTDGSTASWETIVTDPTPTVFMLMGA